MENLSHLLMLPVTALLKNASRLDITQSLIANGHCKVCLSKSKKQAIFHQRCIHVSANNSNLIPLGKIWCGVCEDTKHACFFDLLNNSSSDVFC